MNPRISLRTWFKPLVLEPLSEIKSCLVQIVLSLGLLSLAQGLFLLLIGPLFKAMFETPIDGSFTLHKLLPSTLASWFPSLGLMPISREALSRYLPLSIFAVALINGFAGFIYQHQQQVMALHLGRRYREKLFDAILQLPFQKATQKSPGEWMSIVMNDVAFLQMRLSDLLTGLLRDGIMVLASVLALYFIHWPSAVILTLLALPMMASIGRTGKRIATYAELWQRELGRMVSAVLDLRKRFEFIRAQRGETLEKQRFKQMNHGYYRMIRRSIVTRAALAPAVELAGFLMFAAILWAVTRQVQGFRLDASQLLQFFAALGLVLRPLKSVGEQLARYHETRGILKQSLQTFATVRELAEARPSIVAATPAWNVVQGLHIENISVAYREGFRVSAEKLELLPGKTVALIGPSGAGKSSLIKAFAGLLQVDSWQANQSLESVVKAATLVSQRPFLFSASLRENLLYGHPTGTSDDHLLKELDFVGLGAELKAMDQTLDSAIDFIQTPLSGGQMQRLTIARALLRPQPLLLMDEVTAAIDPLAEEAITRRLIERCQQNKLCLLFVTHRLQQLALFDEIWFVEAGIVRKFASYNQLFDDPRIHRFIADQQSP